MKKTLFLSLLMVCARPSTAQSTLPGLQLGYAYSGVGIMEAGINLYRASIVNGHYHVLGPSAAMTTIFLGNATYVGHRYSFNYHYMPAEKFILGYRVTPAVEFNRKGDMRLGTDIGLSCLGFYLYGGYYFPVGSHENTDITRFRLGVRLVFNGAPVNEAFD